MKITGRRVIFLGPFRACMSDVLDWRRTLQSIQSNEVLRFVGPVRKICEEQLLASPCPPAWNNSALTGRIFMKFDISAFFENLSLKFKFH